MVLRIPEEIMIKDELKDLKEDGDEHEAFARSFSDIYSIEEKIDMLLKSEANQLKQTHNSTQYREENDTFGNSFVMFNELMKDREDTENDVDDDLKEELNNLALIEEDIRSEIDVMNMGFDDEEANGTVAHNINGPIDGLFCDQVLPKDSFFSFDTITDGCVKDWKARAQAMGIRRIREEESDGFRCYKSPLPNSVLKILQSKQVNDDTQSPITQMNILKSNEDGEILLDCHSEYQVPRSTKHLQKNYAGLVMSNENSFTSSTNISEEALPFRTCTIRIRPDVFCGCVMDALSCIVLDGKGEIIKRQSGHMMADLPESAIKRNLSKERKKNLHLDEWEECPNDATERARIMEGGTRELRDYQNNDKIEDLILPPIFMDAQVCVKKNARRDGYNCERILLLRFFEKRNEKRPESNAVFDLMNENIDETKNTFIDENDVINDAAYAIYQMEAEEEGRLPTGTEVLSTLAFLHHYSISTPSFPHDEGQHTPRPLQKIGNIVSSSFTKLSYFNRATEDTCTFIPALSLRHLKHLRSSFNLISHIIHELEFRGLSYTTLLMQEICSTGFVLSKIDPHYCSQIRALCRESMFLELMKTSSTLELDARAAEKRCLDFVRLMMDSTIQNYGVELPTIPQLLPLSTYPLDFIPYEVICPPWGTKVMVAIESILGDASREERNVKSNNKSNQTSHNDSMHEQIMGEGYGRESSLTFRLGRFKEINSAVTKLVCAFSEQCDKELGARVARKNLQIVDRIMKIEQFALKTFYSIEASYGNNNLSTKAAEEFDSMARRAAVPYVIKKMSPSTIEEVDNQDDRPIFFQVVLSSPIQNSPGCATFPLSKRVPIFKCSILTSYGAGICSVTSHELLFSTQGLIFGSGKKYLVSIADIELIELKNPGYTFSSGSTLSVRMYPKFIDHGMNCDIPTLFRASQTEQAQRPYIWQHKKRLKDGWIADNTEEILSFLPSIGAKKFKDFVYAVKVISSKK